MTEYERMKAGLLYDAADEDIMAEQSGYWDKLYEYNATRPGEQEKRAALLKEMLGAVGEGCWVEPPLRANWGGKHLFLGNFVYVNFNLTAVDDGNIYIGDHTMLGPNVTLATANHPIEPGLRERALQYNKDIRIGRNVWIGAGSIVVPGVSIGDNSVIGAGSVVTRDIPENVVAVGNPCRVLREIGERDRAYFYRGERIDWENLNPEEK